MMDADRVLDTSGLQCPLPLLKAKKALSELSVDAVLCVIATDAASQQDFRAYAEISGHHMIKTDVKEGKYFYWVQKKY